MVTDKMNRRFKRRIDVNSGTDVRAADRCGGDKQNEDCALRALPAGSISFVGAKEMDERKAPWRGAAARISAAGS
ncbi:MAG: hypothetical protein H0S80_12480 [Desulfovibrionaceae bacterium]|nr:hypothetical protein [Desulfovibrionaceae bacterium]